VNLTVAVSTRHDETLVELTGVLDYASVPYLRQTVFGLFDDGDRAITVEVSGLRLLDAASIRVLLYLRNRAEHLGGDLRVAGAAGRVLTALEISGVAKRLGAYDEVDWPLAHRQRRPVSLDDLHVPHGQWPPGVTELLSDLGSMEPGDPGRDRLRTGIIELCLPGAHRLARRYGGFADAGGDLLQVAALGLIKAVDGFDPDLGVEFGAYATPTIVGELRRHFRDRTWGIRVPRRLQELRLAVNKVRDELAQTLGRSPTVADLAQHLAVDEEQIIEMLGAGSAYRPLSLDMPADEDGGMTLLDALGADPPEFGMVEVRESLRVAMARLPERQQRILSLRFYGNLTQAEIAEQVGLSQMHVSRQLTQSLALLRRRLTQ
jgi:RNA polymerase sigma-70 factor (sigma-B/F/G subfamily)